MAFDELHDDRRNDDYDPMAKHRWGSCCYDLAFTELSGSVSGTRKHLMPIVRVPANYVLQKSYQWRYAAG